MALETTMDRCFTAGFPSSLVFFLSLQRSRLDILCTMPHLTLLPNGFSVISYRAIGTLLISYVVSVSVSLLSFLNDCYLNVR